MARIAGIGGVFLKPGNEDGLRTFLTTLGVPLEPWGTFFPWREREDPEKKGYTVIGLFDRDSDYFAPSDQAYMVNFRVDDLDGVLAILKEQGHEVLKQVDEPKGRFAHVMVGEGMKVDLWEPAAPDPYDSSGPSRRARSNPSENGPRSRQPGGFTMLLAITLAFAQHVEIDATAVLTADDLPWEASSVGHPAIWPNDDGFAMVFESTVDVPDCEQGYQIGRATSADGFSWTIGDRSLGPDDDAPCGYREPVVANTSDGLLLLVRAAHDDAVWARRVTGRRVSRWRVSGLDDLESFSVARRDGTWTGVGIDPDLGMVTLRSPDARTWTRDSSAVLHYGDTWWSLDGMTSPSVSCFDGPTVPWVMHYGGWTDSDHGFTYGVSDDLDLWFLSLAARIWLDSDAWVAWDSIATRSSAWVAFEDHGVIGWASTDGGVPVDPATRDCTSAP